MELKSIKLFNYRSVKEIEFIINPISDGSFTYGLIGVNEAGKSSILKGLSLQILYAQEISTKDFNNSSESIVVEYEYLLPSNFSQKLLKYINEKYPQYLSLKLKDLEKLTYIIEFKNGEQLVSQWLYLDYTFEEQNITFEFIDELHELFNYKIHNTIFWSSDEKYLITKPISLLSFSANPSNVSVPLLNCFKLAGITDIKDKINQILSDSTEREDLREQLGKSVTAHIKRAWPQHPVKITFDISDGQLHFHVKDENSSSKSKTVDQRSDGFKHFISFLLTVSAEYLNSELENTILLLDEPETHLHPKAQQELLKELIAITKNKKNNIVFFATHSNYMIDKEHLSRNYIIKKPKDITEIQSLSEKKSSYASVNYEVFDISSTDYHNELYATAQVKSGIEKLDDFDKKIINLYPKILKKDYVKLPTKKKVNYSLPTYIRNQIHHPENELNKRFTEAELDKSIKYLLQIIILLPNNIEE